MKILRVDDDVHKIITGLAEAEDRGITAYLNRHFRHLKGEYGVVTITGVPDNTPLPKNHEPQNPEKIKSEPSGSGASPGEWAATEQPCCLNEITPCRHWSWDGVKEGYVNSLSSRFREVEG